ncbi:MAG: peptidoglycan-binding protein [Gammaproteobacteria bacterium]|nr:peptidoglycan-binding protein [Gammaproteobacteria bacterium]
MSAEQIAQAQRLAQQWKLKSPSLAAISPAALAQPPSAPRYPSHLVRAIQTKLRALGYNAGPVDGHYGRRTATAIGDYQRDRDMTLTGIPSKQLSDSLDVALSKAD